MWFHHRIMCPNDADEIANSVDPDWSSQIWVYTVCSACVPENLGTLRYLQMSKKIYFCGSIRGGLQDTELYIRLINILKTYGTVLTEHIWPKVLAGGKSHAVCIYAGFSLELSDRKKISNSQGEVLVIILDFPVFSIHLNVSLSTKRRSEPV